jgi:hypothetical protein
VYLYEVSRNGKTQSEPAVLARRRAVSLAKSIEDVRQKLFADTTPGIRDAYLNRATGSRHFHTNAPAIISKLDRIR